MVGGGPILYALTVGQRSYRNEGQAMCARELRPGRGKGECKHPEARACLKFLEVQEFSLAETD